MNFMFHQVGKKPSTLRDDVNEYFVKPDGQHVPFPPEINKLEASRSTQKIMYQITSR